MIVDADFDLEEQAWHKWLEQLKKPVAKEDGDVEEYAVDEEGNNGIWRTIRGRAVFIRDGESMQSALKRSLAYGKGPEHDEGKVTATLKEVESKGAYAAKTESGWIIGADGKLLRNFTSGEGGYVVVPDAAQRLMQDSVFTHNHPSGGSFSRSDLLVASGSNVREMRAFGTLNGKRVQYSLLRPEGGWPSSDKLGSAYVTEDGKAKKRWLPQVSGGKVKLEEAFATGQHEILQAVAKRYGITYTRREL